MKKYLTLLLVALLAFMVACGAEGADNDKIDNEDNGSDTEENIQDEQEENAEVEIMDIEYYEWTDEAVDEETITVYAEVKNNSDTSIDAGFADITYLDSNGSVISVNEDQVSPRFLSEGGTGYVTAEIEDDIDKYDDLDEVDIEVSPETFQDAEIVEFPTRDEKLNVDKWGQESAKISVTGFLENESDTNFVEDDTMAIIGLYDEKDNFLAAESMYQDQWFSIDAKDETSFEIAGGSPLPPEVGEKVDNVEVKAIGIVNLYDYW